MLSCDDKMYYLLQIVIIFAIISSIISDASLLTFFVLSDLYRNPVVDMYQSRIAPVDIVFK